MRNPIEVVIRDPRRGWPEMIGGFVGQIAALFILGWLLTLLTPVAFHIEVGYWQAVCIILAARTVIPHSMVRTLGSTEKQRKVTL